MQSQQSFIGQVFSQFISVDWTLVITKYSTLPVLCCHIMHGESQALSSRNTKKREKNHWFGQIKGIKYTLVVSVNWKSKFLFDVEAKLLHLYYTPILGQNHPPVWDKIIPQFRAKSSPNLGQVKLDRFRGFTIPTQYPKNKWVGETD